jgi:hypothetical protein
MKGYDSSSQAKKWVPEKRRNVPRCWREPFASSATRSPSHPQAKLRAGLQSRSREDFRRSVIARLITSTTVRFTQASGEEFACVGKVRGNRTRRTRSGDSIVLIYRSSHATIARCKCSEK